MKKILASIFVTMAVLQAGAANAAWYDGGFANGKFIQWMADTWVCGWDGCI